MDEMKTRPPTLLSILESCTETRKVRMNKEAIVGLIIAILCKHRRPSASLLQQIVSVILYSGHASKRVSFPSNRSSSVYNYIYNYYIAHFKSQLLGVSATTKAAALLIP